MLSDGLYKGNWATVAFWNLALENCNQITITSLNSWRSGKSSHRFDLCFIKGLLIPPIPVDLSEMLICLSWFLNLNHWGKAVLFCCNKQSTPNPVKCWNLLKNVCVTHVSKFTFFLWEGMWKCEGRIWNRKVSAYKNLAWLRKSVCKQRINWILLARMGLCQSG